MDLNNYAYNELYVSDLHKDARGIRCRIDFNDGTWTKEEIDWWADSLHGELQASMEEERKREAEALEEYLNRINNLIVNHSITKEDAIRWDVQANGSDIECKQDVEYYLWQNGIGYRDSMSMVPTILKALAA